MLLNRTEPRVPEFLDVDYSFIAPGYTTWSVAIYGLVENNIVIVRVSGGLSPMVVSAELHELPTRMVGTTTSTKTDSAK